MGRRYILLGVVNGIAIGILELKNSRVSIGEGLRQNRAKKSDCKGLRPALPTLTQLWTSRAIPSPAHYIWYNAHPFFPPVVPYAFYPLMQIIEQSEWGGAISICARCRYDASQ